MSKRLLINGSKSRVARRSRRHLDPCCSASVTTLVVAGVLLGAGVTYLATGLVDLFVNCSLNDDEDVSKQANRFECLLEELAVAVLGILVLVSIVTGLVGCCRTKGTCTVKPARQRGRDPDRVLSLGRSLSAKADGTDGHGESATVGV